LLPISDMSFNVRSHVSVAELSAAKIAIKLQQLLLSYSVTTLHKAFICFTEHRLNELK